MTLLAVLALVVGACAPDEEDVDETPDEDVSDEVDDADDEATDDGTTDDGGIDEPRTASVHLPQNPRGFNPLIPQIQGDQLINQLHHAGLVMTDGDRQYLPRAATDWTVNDEGTIWTFGLNTDMGWSDGEPFTVDDVVFSYTLWADPASGSSLAGNLADVVGVDDYLDGSADEIAGLRAVDEQTFEVELNAPNVAFVDSIIQPIFHILPEHILGDVPLEELSDDPWFREPTAGLGPYVFERWVTDDEVEFIANSHYPQEPGLDRIFARVADTDVAAAQLDTGELDLAQVAPSGLERASGIDGVTIHRQEGVGIMALHTALDAGKLDDPLVRQAILYAIDRQAIVDEVLAGEAIVVDTLVHGPDWAVPSDLPSYEYDPDRARELLAESGFDLSTEIRFEVVPTQTDRVALATIAAGQLQAVGLEGATVQPYEPAQLSEAIGERDFDLLISEYGNFVTDPHSMTARLGCDFVGGSNIVAYCNEELDDLLRQGIATTDQSEREEIYAEAQRIFAEDLPILPIYVSNSLFGTTERFQGFEPHGAIIDAFWNAPDWTVTS